MKFTAQTLRVRWASRCEAEKAGQQGEAIEMDFGPFSVHCKKNTQYLVFRVIGRERGYFQDNMRGGAGRRGGGCRYISGKADGGYR